MTKVVRHRVASNSLAATHRSVTIEQRRAEATKTSHGSVSGAVPLSTRPDLKSHPATKSSLIWLYDNPSEVGGWIGGIEPEAESWIAFVSTDGKVFLWEKRDSSGGVIGTPVTFNRPDLVTNKVVASLRMKCEAYALGNEAANGRFRIFKEGTIKTDFGLSIMNPKFGRAVIAEFERRGNDMPIDLRHGMLAENPTLEQSEAYGWIPCPGGLEYVDGDGLYARGVQWDPRVKAGLESKPPRWKYFSPTYDVDKETRAILKLDNVALTNLPATHSLNRLAAERGNRMDLAQLGTLLVLLMGKADGGDADAASYRDALIAGLGDQVDAAMAAAKTDVAPDSTDDFMASMSEEDKASYAAMSEPMKAVCKAGMLAMKAEKKPDEVAAEAPKEEPVKASISAEQILLMAEAETTKTTASRQKIVAELVASKKIAKGGEVEKVLLDPSLPDDTFTKVVAARKTASVTIQAPAKLPASPAPTTKNVDGVTQQQRIEAEQLAKKNPNVNVQKVLAQVALNNRAGL